jgi:isoleucyl-tRNA synthetase
LHATDQWFASVENFRDACIKAIDSVTWMPSVGKNRITPMIEGRSDWCISRQRNWGVPIPVFYHKETGEALLTEESINHVRDVVAEHGTDAWWELPVKDLLPPSHKDDADNWETGRDTMDVWFDSGSSWNGVANKWGDGEALAYPADMYLEGSDQHRGWFQSSLLTSVAANGIAPYKTVLTHGSALPETRNPAPCTPTPTPSTLYPEPSVPCATVLTLGFVTGSLRVRYGFVLACTRLCRSSTQHPHPSP